MANNLIAVGTPTFAAGKFGNAVDTSNGYLQVPANVFASSTGFTVEYWAKTTSSAGYQIVFGHSGAEWFGFSNGVPAGIFHGGSATTGSTATADGAWHHYAWTLDTSGNFRCWVDGALVFTIGATLGNTADWSAGSLVHIGRWASSADGSNPAFPFLGQVDELRVSNVARYATPFTPPTTAFTGDASTLGLYHFEADGTDSTSGGGPAPDTTAPTVPTGLTATPGSGQVALSWAAATDAVGVTGYRVRRGGTVVASPTATSYTDTGLTNGTQYSYTVSAVDAASNESAQTSAVTATPVASAPTGGTIAPNDTNIVYSPYTWEVTATAAQTINAGAYLRASFTGSATSVAATFDTAASSAGAVVLAIRVDNEPVYTATVAASVTIPLPANNWPTHTVEIVATRIQGGTKWATTPTTSVRFTGFTVAPTTVATRVNRRAPLNVLCYGDSLAEGYSTYASGINEVRLGWAYPLRDLLGAEIGVVGFNAVGFLQGGEAGVPAFGSGYNLLRPGASRPFTTPAQPDLVVINMGTNDSGDITNTATAVLNGILGATAITKIAVVQQWGGTTHRAQWQAAIAACTAPSRVTYLDTTGWVSGYEVPDGLHPYGYVNKTDLAPRLAAQLAPLLAGSGGTSTPKRFINRGGVAVAIG